MLALSVIYEDAEGEAQAMNYREWEDDTDTTQEQNGVNTTHYGDESKSRTESRW